MEHPDAPEGFCSCCERPCTAVYRDVGIGRYEYWGQVETQVDYRWVSPCCEAEVVDELESGTSTGDSET